MVLGIKIDSVLQLNVITSRVNHTDVFKRTFERERERNRTFFLFFILLFTAHGTDLTKIMQTFQNVSLFQLGFQLNCYNSNPFITVNCVCFI